MPNDPFHSKRTLAMELELHQSATLLTVLTTIARLGGVVTHLVAQPGRARLVIEAPATSANRFAPVLRVTMGVLELAEIDAEAAVHGAQRATAAGVAMKQSPSERASPESHLAREPRRLAAAS